MEQSPFAKEFIRESTFRMEESTPRILKCLNELTEEEVWQRPNASLNSIGNLILHLCGNIRQYAISSLRSMPDSRVRDEEFSAQGGYTKAELVEKLTATVNEAIATINAQDDTSLLRTRLVQGFELSGIGIIIHVTEHYSYHTGQIAFWTKFLKDKDLGFYAGLDLNVKNEG